MDREVRAARRPMPRQLDVSDWNVDADVRAGVSSVVVSQSGRERSAFSTEAGRLTSTHEELRSRTSAVLRPVNRYDDSGSSSDYRSGLGGVSRWTQGWSPAVETGVSSRQGSRGENSLQTTRRAQARAMPRALNPQSEYLGPRRAPSSAQVEESRRDHDYSVVEADAHRADQVRRETDTIRVTWRDRQQQSTASSVFQTPVREQIRPSMAPDTVRSDATTAMISPGFTHSITDSPSTTLSSMPSSPYTMESDIESPTRITTPHVTPQPLMFQTTSPAPADVMSDTSSRSSHQEISNRTSHTMQFPVDERIQAHPVSVSLSPKEQREQLYDFRRDMRQVFARIDEMVDMHRDMFKSDTYSGMPQFDAMTAQDTAAFAKTTFDELEALRERFEAMTTGWTSSQRASTEIGSGQISRSDMTRHEQTSDSISSVTSSQHGQEPSSSDQLSSVDFSTPSSFMSPSSVSSSSISSATPPQGPHREHPRWEPTLSSLSSDSSSSSPPSPISSDQSSLPSCTAMFRPTAAAHERESIFANFDKRMEEIRSSLSAMNRRQSSQLKSRAASSRDESGGYAFENNSQRANVASSDRASREACLRQLLQDLRDTSDDDA